ncbi:MAG: ABC transporter permease subunit [Deltaproteobacteria bacterium]|nr:ABC transporter permease subunit [Deltaproteobacteria bacterium]
MKFFLLFTFFCSLAQANTLDKIRERGVLLWGADAAGAAPYLFPNPRDPNELIGFEVELAHTFAKELGVAGKQVQINWESLIPSLQKKDFDLSLDGIEITPDRQKVVLFSRPFFVYTEQLVVRKDESHIKRFEDLKGKKVGTLAASAAMEILENLGGVHIQVYESQVQPYDDLVLGRIDAVFLDLPIAEYFGRPNPKLKFLGEPIGEGYYGVAIRKEDVELKTEIDRIIEKLLKNGTLQGIYEKWGIWNKSQEKLLQWDERTSITGLEQAHSEVPLSSFLPTLLRGARTTIFLSCASMGLAILLGLFLTLIRLYGPRPLSDLSYLYIEIYRGTPILVQLFILYYGLPNIGITLSPIAASIIGLGMNYAAYEAEAYRAGISAIPKGQLEAGSALGMTRVHIISRILLPQAIRISLPVVTNDFIALFKDSSIVSMVAMVELTKTYTILATTKMRFFELGLVTAFLYFAMSYPLSFLSRHLEKKMKRGFV